ncbi:2-methylisocitrate lyase-like PEP mutase family enzyme [Ancylobacter aquaticus]|uniref:2-methylisocitrate lyase-like PEP mutase family enzyme n=1 Tax=Ancylobacter aquaticus TaxID=100 RepID=A0A4R1IAZ0_ANCAQ|nr:isocitrate lyase/phosphoenolpyruvate mutase family protein [Ancylobacter aquaticus]TCK31463.1 2-methylisocitrate lyase-like PEP mutase family enzyme [Ancylobacter aquaticus]
MDDKATRFRALHEGPGAFILPNPWDAGTARIFAALGYPALATTSAGMAFSNGVRDGDTGRDAMLAHCALIVAATALPVSADLENGFGDAPEAVAETIRAAARTGLAGGSIEDHTGRPDAPIYDLSLAVERIAAAAEARRGLAGDFVLTARAENFLWGRPDLDDTIRRLQAFEAAGADVLYAPGLPDIAAVRTVCSAVSRPVNVVIGIGSARFTRDELSKAGVRRISIGSSLARLAYGSIARAARAMAREGRFDFLDEAMGFAEIEAFFTPFEGQKR